MTTDRYQEALTPSADTKAAYAGDFKFDIEDGTDPDSGHLYHREVQVPWTTIKEIMLAIRTRAEGPKPYLNETQASAFVTALMEQFPPLKQYTPARMHEIVNGLLVDAALTKDDRPQLGHIV